MIENDCSPLSDVLANKEVLKVLGKSELHICYIQVILRILCLHQVWDFHIVFDELVNEYFSRCQKKVQLHLVLYFSGRLRVLDVITLSC